MTYLEPEFLIETFGLIGVLFIIFAESGLFFGFFLPGDSLLFTAGFFASQGFLNISLLVVGGIGAAILGDSVGYWTGRKVGESLFTKEDSLFFKKRHLERSHAFFEKYGKKTIFLARFVPVVRTFAPILAGIARMEYRTFLSYNVFGALVWAGGIPLLGYGFGQIVPNAHEYLPVIIIGIIGVSFIPVVREYMKSRRKKDVSM